MKPTGVIKSININHCWMGGQTLQKIQLGIDITEGKKLEYVFHKGKSQITIVNFDNMYKHWRVPYLQN